MTYGGGDRLYGTNKRRELIAALCHFENEAEGRCKEILKAARELLEHYSWEETRYRYREERRKWQEYNLKNNAKNRERERARRDAKTREL